MQVVFDRRRPKCYIDQDSRLHSYTAGVFVNVHLAYGRRGLDVTLPDRNVRAVLTMGGAVPLEEPSAALRHAIDHPIGGQPLRKLAARARNACVVINDITRPVPNRLILPPLLETLEGSGIARDAITILVATGLHRPSTPEEREEMVGREILSRWRIIDHQARVSAGQQYLGTTTRGTPVFIDRVYCEADLKITTGFIEPHLMAGFSGGRKVVSIGCAGEETIKTLHSPRFLEQPECCEGSIEKNPLHHELLEIAAMAGHDFILNVSLDVSHAITGIFCGDPVLAHEAGVHHVRGAVKAVLPEPVDIVITSSAGYPLDLTYYQAVKGITAALPVVRQGGMLIVAAECAEGLGSREFATMATIHNDVHRFIETITSHPVVIDQWQLEECAKAARQVDVVLVSENVHASHSNTMFIRTARTVEDALREGFRKLGDDASIAVIPKGPYTLVEIGSPQT